MAQIVETSLLNHLNYPTLVATKASRVVDAGRGRPVIEFGLRRGPERAANAGARAALVGGAVSTSNVGVAVSLGFAPKGTHAHSLVQVYLAMGRGELEAFRAFAEVYPDDTVLLVDTVDTLESGVPNAITVFEELRARGHEPLGIRLDSGDLAYLAIRSAEMLDNAGFADDLDRPLQRPRRARHLADPPPDRGRGAALRDGCRQGHRPAHLRRRLQPDHLAG